jgi:hypothetical protein
MGEGDQMKRRGMTAPVALFGIIAVLGIRPVLAAPARCGQLQIECDAGVRERWPDLSEQVREAFQGRDDVDTCAAVLLEMLGGAIRLEVRLPDGRTAGRSVWRREDVVPALEALILVPGESDPPPAERAAATPATTTPRPSDHPAVQPEIAPTVVQREAARRERPPSSFGVDLSIAAAARAGDGQVGAGIGLVSFLELAHWLVGFQGQLDRYIPTSGGPPSMASELGVLMGRRFRFASTTLDVVAGPALVLRGVESVTQSAGTGTGMSSQIRSDPLPRLLAAARLSLGHSALRSFVQLDGDLGPAQADSDAMIPGSARLPVWTFGVALGATVGTR